MAKMLMTLTSVVALAWSGTAQAQNGSLAGEAPPSQAEDAGVATSGDQGDENEIIVTAQRRSQRLVDVPISVSTASLEDLERAGPTSLENLTKVMPGVYLQRSTYGLSPTVRGIGSTLPTSSGEQTVALYIDEIYYPIPTGNVFDLGSVAGVEVLKGPQGTLFGRNATGGAILIRTLDPGFDVAGRFNISYERFDQVRGSAYVNLPLSDTVAFNASAAYRHSRGYIRDLQSGAFTNEGESFVGRAKLLVQPTDNFSITFVAAHSEFDDPTGTDIRNLEPAPIVSALGGPISTDPRRSSFNTEQFIRTRTTEYSARAKLEVDGGTFSSFTALVRNRLAAFSDLDGSYLDQNVDLLTTQKTFMQEVNFASAPDKPLTYVAGLYYFRSTGGLPYIFQNGAPLYFNRFRDWAAAAYLDGTYRIGDFSIIGGIRYTHEKRFAETGFGATEDNGTVGRVQDGSDSQWTPRLGLSYAVGPRSNVYATYSKGFKSGRFDRSTLAGPGVAAEKLDAFELGFKSASRDLSFNAAIFYYDYKDQQVNATVTLPNGGIVTQLFNAPKSESYGAEADATFSVNDNFELRAAVAYTRSRYVEFENAPIYVDDPTNPATLGGLLYANVSGDVSGRTMVRSPKLTASGMVRFHAPVGDGDLLEATLSPYYSSRVYFTFDNSLSQKAYLTLDGAVTLTLDEKMKLSIFGRNLTDRIYRTAAAQNALSLDSSAFAQPRTIGVSLGYSF